MPIKRRLLFFFLALSFASLALSEFAQQGIPPVPVGLSPGNAAVNPNTVSGYRNNADRNNTFFDPRTRDRRMRVQAGTVSNPLYGIDFSPYENGQNPNINPYVSADQITARLQIIAPYTQWIRSFSMTTGLENIPPIARSFGLRVAAGAWISANLTQNDQEIANLITAANAGNVDIAIVGSEVLLRGDVSESQLIAHMTQVRQAIPSNILVTTADTYGELISHPNIIAASDVVFGNFYPYWEGQSINNAVCALVSEYNQLQSASGSKQIIVSETGWPSGGDAVGAAVPSPANAAQYSLQFVTWARSNNVAFFYFEAFNEEWKVRDEGPQGAP